MSTAGRVDRRSFRATAFDIRVTPGTPVWLLCPAWRCTSRPSGSRSPTRFPMLRRSPTPTRTRTWAEYDRSRGSDRQRTHRRRSRPRRQDLALHVQLQRVHGSPVRRASRRVACRSTSTTGTSTTNSGTCSTTPTPKRCSSTRRSVTAWPGSSSGCPTSSCWSRSTTERAPDRSRRRARTRRSSRQRADGAHRTGRGRHLHALHGRHDRDAQGRDVRQWWHGCWPDRERLPDSWA